jgi:hypothetical protein
LWPRRITARASSAAKVFAPLSANDMAHEVEPVKP